MPNADGSATKAETEAAERDALERNYAGLLGRLEELKAMPAAHPDQIKAAEADVAEARKLLPKAANKRPKKAAEKR